MYKLPPPTEEPSDLLLRAGEFLRDVEFGVDDSESCGEFLPEREGGKEEDGRGG
jgi:hypothetical protein